MMHNPILFTPLLILSFAVFFWSAWRKLSLVTLGKPERRFDHIVRRFGWMLQYAFAQRRVLAKPIGLVHFVIFWSFMILLISNSEFMLHGVFPSISMERLPAEIYHPLAMVTDVVSLLALAAVIFAAIRRIVSPPYPEARSLEGFFILGLIALLMLAYFGINASRITFGEMTGVRAWLPISEKVVQFIPGSSAMALYAVFWWLHAASLLLFLNYLPYSKHMHIMTAIPNCFLRRIEKPNTQSKEEFIAGNIFGVSSVDHFTWKDLLDSFSCTECGRCQLACPAGITGKPLNPRAIIHDIKVNLLKNGPLIKSGKKSERKLIGDEGEGSISEEAIWSCTTCGACMESCPVLIEQMPRIIQLRRHLVENEAKFPAELLNLFENMESRSNPWGIAPTERTKWYSQMKVKPFESGTTEYLFFVGCAGSFDPRSKQVTVSLALLLDKAGISWGVLGKDEHCCGDSVRRLGNEYVFDRMAKENAKLFIEHGVKKVITQCPHCFSTLKNDYRQYGLELEVIHHSELLRNLVRQKKLVPKAAKGFGVTVYHDSCYLGRHNDIYSAPRELLSAATGSVPVEMNRNRNNAFCCGAGGGRMWMEETSGERINRARVEEALEKKPDTICVSCPYCMTMFDDGLKDAQAGDVRVKDIAEVLAEAVLK
jgi:Fe-S oxidoreductase